MFDVVVVFTGRERVEELFSCILSLRIFRHGERDTVDPRVAVALEGKAVEALRFLEVVFCETAGTELTSAVTVVAAKPNLFIIFRSAPFSILKTVSSVLFCCPSASSLLSPDVFVRWFFNCLTHPKQQFRASSDVW